MALTRHEEGSIRELWTMALPLMLSSFSVMSMLFVDRLLLANYSTQALNAAVNSATFGWVFVYGGMVMTSIAEVFVAQYNGAGLKKRIGEPVWQMIWLSLGSFLLFMPLGYWGGELFFGVSEKTHLEREYFKWMMYFGSSYPLYGALCGFFVGQGKTKLVTWLAIIANILNALLDIALIFGVEGITPPLGVMGAAIATSGSTIFQVIVLGYVFLNGYNRSEHGTADCRFLPKAFWQCVRIGFPGAAFAAVEVLGWAVFYWMMTMVSETHITIAGICQSVALLFYFFAEGISKAATAIVGNFIGAQRLWFVPRVIASGVKLHILFLLLMLVFYMVYTDFFIEQFLPMASQEHIDSIYDTLSTCMLCILLYMFFEGIRLLLAGVLTAAGDTFFLLIAGSLSVWVMLVLPVYFVVVKGQARMEIASLFCALYSLGACLIYLWRFMEGKWKSISITA